MKRRSVSYKNHFNSHKHSETSKALLPYGSKSVRVSTTSQSSSSSSHQLKKKEKKKSRSGGIDVVKLLIFFIYSSF